MNGIYIYLAIKEIAPFLINKFISRISARDRLIQVEFEEESLFISLYPEALGFYIDKKIRDFEILGFFNEHIQGARIGSATQIGFSPVIDLAGEKIEYGQRIYLKIRLSLYKEGPNFSLFLNNVRRDLYPKYIEKGTKLSIMSLTPEDLENRDSLIDNFEGIDRFLARELNRENLEMIKKIMNGASHKPKIVDILPLRISLFSGEYRHEFENWNELLKYGIKSFIEEKAKFIQMRERKELIRKIEKKIEKLKREIIDETKIEFYKIAGELILMNLSKIKKGMAKIRLFNHYTGQDIDIELNQMKDARQNAEEYFKKYKKLKKGIPRIKERIRKLEAEIEVLKSGGEIKKREPVAPGIKSKDIEKKIPFREFILESGSHVYAGKDAKSNMELTFKFARPDDYFFHSRGYEGAHIILRPVLKKGQNVKRGDIEQAAAIAAYYSKAKNQKNVAVSYTQRKYLKKSKKGKMGTVILMREDVIFVDPGLPSDTQD